ncbi:MAG: hypothetical protein OSB03_11890, partial [Vicinamibacterales bacterium]|nr:hypothetical protein [Vicinamibacterales bacterium]
EAVTDSAVNEFEKKKEIRISTDIRNTIQTQLEVDARTFGEITRTLMVHTAMADDINTILGMDAMRGTAVTHGESRLVEEHSSILDALRAAQAPDLTAGAAARIQAELANSGEHAAMAVAGQTPPDDEASPDAAGASSPSRSRMGVDEVCDHGTSYRDAWRVLTASDIENAPADHILALVAEAPPKCFGVANVITEDLISDNLLAPECWKAEPPPDAHEVCNMVFAKLSAKVKYLHKTHDGPPSLKAHDAYEIMNANRANTCERVSATWEVELERSAALSSRLRLIYNTATRAKFPDAKTDQVNKRVEQMVLKAMNRLAPAALVALVCSVIGDLVAVANTRAAVEEAMRVTEAELEHARSELAETNAAAAAAMNDNASDEESLPLSDDGSDTKFWSGDPAGTPE